MYKNIILLLLCFINSDLLEAQILPKEGSKLNYRLIGFSFPVEQKAKGYSLEIAKGNYYSEDSFKKNIIKKLACNERRIIAEVPAFGMPYSWRVVYAGSNHSIKKSEFHHFSTATSFRVEADSMRLKVLTPNEKYKDDYIFLDNDRVLYDMAGKPIWFMPDINGITNISRDMRLSPQGTITFLVKDSAYEINYNGDILWRAPNNGKVSGDSEERYHHEFTRLASGHYMILGDEGILWNKKLPPGKDGNWGSAAVKANPQFAHFGTIIEYDEKGNVVWSWKSSNYFKSSDIDYYNGGDVHGDEVIPVHENAFYFDEKNNIIYVGFKNISRILKVKYPEGIVLNTYGEIYEPDTPVKGNGLFCGQHSIGRAYNGCLYLFNNNLCNPGNAATVIMMKEPTAQGEKLKKIWEYVCPVEAGSPAIFTTGGNVTELNDHSLFVCMGATLSKILIVNMDKKITWSALPETWSYVEKKWKMVSQYRANIFEGKKNIEKLVWSAENY
jgi:hypothetical protein